MKSDKADFTQGSILKKLVAFMMPVLGALILQAAYGAVDLLVVGRFGSTSGLAAFVFFWFITLETVETETFACLAISFNVIITPRNLLYDY